MLKSGILIPNFPIRNFQTSWHDVIAQTKEKIMETRQPSYGFRLVPRDLRPNEYLIIHNFALWFLFAQTNPAVNLFIVFYLILPASDFHVQLRRSKTFMQ